MLGSGAVDVSVLRLDHLGGSHRRRVPASYDLSLLLALCNRLVCSEGTIPRWLFAGARLKGLQRLCRDGHIHTHHQAGT